MKASGGRRDIGVWRWRPLLASLACAIALACVAPVGTAAAGSPADGPFPQDTLPDGRVCPLVMFFGLRGDYDALPNDSFTSPSYPMDGSGIGADVQAFDQEIKDWLINAGWPSSWLKEQGVPYDADYLQYTGDDVPYGQQQGNAINQYIGAFRQDCPRTFIVVVAQSLGAMVLHYADQVPHYAGAIVMFGDPLHWPGCLPQDKAPPGQCAPIDSGGDDSGYGIATGKDGNPLGLVAIPQDMWPQYYPSDPLDTAYQANSYCLYQDGVCGSPNTGEALYYAWQGNHTKYRFNRDKLLENAEAPVQSAFNDWLEYLVSLSPSPSPLPPAPTPGPVSPPAAPPPMDGLFLYNSSSGASYTELPDGSGGWKGIAGPPFSAGWQVYPGRYAWNGRTGLFVYNPSNGDNWVEFADTAGGWQGIKGPSMSAGWQVHTGDFLGNGRTELFLYNPNNGNNWIEVPSGTGGWTGIQGPSFSAGWSVYTGDFNGDGRTDLWVYNRSSGANWVELANGSGGWTGVKGPSFSAGWSVYTGDFNGDGRTDLWVYNPSSGANWVELANGSGGWTGVKGPSFSAGWSVYTGDFNGDGRTDLFVYNPSSGANWVELANGSGGWTGVKGPSFSAGWSVYTGVYN